MTVILDEVERREVRRKAGAATLAALRSLGGEARRDPIREWAISHGGFTQRETMAPPPERVAGQYASLVDHDLSWALTDLKRAGVIENPQRGVWTLAPAAEGSLATPAEGQGDPGQPLRPCVSPPDAEPSSADTPDIDPGVAGRSARLQAERKHERILQSKQSKSGVSKLITALVGPSSEERRMAADEKHWATGAKGEQMLGEALAHRCPGVSVLHDRRMPHSRANIDHIAVAASGLYVIDTKRYRGKIEVLSPWFGNPKLKINGRDRTKLIDGLDRQVAVVKAAVATVAPDAPVHGCLCFLPPEGLFSEVGLPVLRTLKINGYALYYPRRLAKRLNGPGLLTPEDVSTIYVALAQEFPPA